MTTFSFTESTTFTIAHAQRIASKVATDLHRFQRFYGYPSDAWIAAYEQELVIMLRHDFLEDVVYGFKRDGRWTEASIRYVALPGGDLSADDDPGKIRPNLDVDRAIFTSFLTRNSKWHNMTAHDRESVQRELPFERITGAEPSIEAGFWASDLNYIAGGRGLGRSVVWR